MARGRLRIYLGAAPGVGKTFAMLAEGCRRRARGTDVVVGFVETHGRPRTAEQVGDLELVPRLRLEHRGGHFEEMDVDAILRRKPALALVDELAHTNVPGSRNEKRWQDIEELLEAGIDVLSTVNIQHLESLNDVVERITGVRQRETVPDAEVRRADQIELVDMTPEALRRRMAHGNIYAPEKVDAALANYFRPGNLTALRELALLWLADRVDEALQTYMEQHDIEEVWETRERIVVALTGGPEGEVLIRRAARIASRQRGDLLAVHVVLSDGLAGASPAAIAQQRTLVESLGGEFHQVTGGDVTVALLDFARAERATQIVVGASRRSRLASLFRPGSGQTVIRESGSIDVHVVSHDYAARGRLLPRRVPLDLPRGRRASGWLIVGAGLPVVTVLLANLRGFVSLPSVLLIYLTVVVSTAIVGGAYPAIAGAFGAFLLANWFFTPPFYTFTIAEHDNLIALLVFLSVAAAVSSLARVAERRTAEAARSAREAETLAEMAGSAMSTQDSLSTLARQVQRTFGVDGVAVLGRDNGAWRAMTQLGDGAPTSPESAATAVPVDDQTVLALTGPALHAEDQRLLGAFADELAVVLRSRRLTAEAASAGRLAEIDATRTALLHAVSHDLRTPLASIKASVSSLLQRDVDWRPEDVHEFLLTIDEETDRLNGVVGNLLDMSRIETGALTMQCRPVGLDEVVPRALSYVAGAQSVVVDVPEHLPRVNADPGLLERVIANLVSNALTYSPPDAPPMVTASDHAERVELRVVDRGPGIPEAERSRVFEPFQRLGDRGAPTGVGLGLAVARGFTEAMGGVLTLEDTPGGGVTLVVSLPEATP